MIKEIINDKTFLELINNLMNSPVMKDAYNCLYYWYSTNGEYDIEKENLGDMKDINEINEHSIIYHYEEFCKFLKDSDKSNIFILMKFPQNIKRIYFSLFKNFYKCRRN